VFSRLSNSDVYQESLEELDAALSEMTSNVSFPQVADSISFFIIIIIIIIILYTLILELIRLLVTMWLLCWIKKQGLAHLTSATLTKARGFVLEHFIQTLPLRDSHLRAFLTAVIEMELDELSETQHDCLNAYLNKLTLQNTSLNSIPDDRGFTKDLVISSPNIASINKIEKCIGDDFTRHAVQEIFKRRCAVSCISTVETGLNTLSNVIRHSSQSDSNLLNEQLKNENALM